MNSEDTIPTSGKFQDPEKGFALWKELEDTAYERIITSQHDFVRFMQSMHVPDDAILFPPEGGWPEITKESFRSLGKSDKVIEILRNMAYIEDPSGATPREILDGKALADYREPYVVEQITSGKAQNVLGYTERVDEPDESVPRDVIGLTVGDMYGGSIFLDCRHGIVRWPDGPGQTSFGINTRGDPSGEGDEDWGSDTAWPVEEFFDYIKEKFRSLEQLAFNQRRLIEKDLFSKEPVYDFDLFKEMYERHGWPGPDYNKEACMKEMVGYCEENLIC